MYHSRRLVSSADASAASSPESTQSSEPWYDGLGYCTWNSLGQSLTEDKILNALDDLVDSGISVSSLIVDDNWQSIDQHGDTQYDHGWLDFEADPRSFPRGLAATVSTIRERHPGIRDIAVWHALLGYWGGISPDGPLSARYKTVDVPRRDGSLPIGGTMRVVEGADEVQRLYDDFYGFLAAAGITSVKTDAQFMVDTWLARRDLAYTYLDAWAHSALRHFAMRATSCMSLFPQAIFRAQTIPGPTFALRSSDDFAPDEPSAHAWHVWANAHNCVLLQFLDIVPDWDMFQTAHDFAGFHAAARCVSGGPICITDVPGCHDRNIISQISGTTLDGRTTIFRPSVMGKAVNPFVGYHDNAFLKVGSYNGGRFFGPQSDV